MQKNQTDAKNGSIFACLCEPGVYVMITIFCDFSQFSAEKLAFFLNTNVMINFFQNLALFRVKNAKFFRNFFKNPNIGSRLYVDFIVFFTAKLLFDVPIV
jgi:hypothetical protein